jgi:hypothetical protein
MTKEKPTCSCGRTVPPKRNPPRPDIGECEHCRMFVCVTCGKDTSWDNGCDGDMPESCDDCWWKWSRSTSDPVLDTRAARLGLYRRRGGETNGVFVERVKDVERRRSA